MHQRMLFLILLIAPLTGCFLRYVDPTMGATATILFKKNTQYNSDVKTYVNAKDCSGGRPRIITPSDDSDKLIKVPAGQEFTFTMALDLGVSGMGMNTMVFKGCVPTATFVPEAGASYIAEVTANESGCNISLTKAVNGNQSDQQPVEFQRRTYRQGFSESSSFCS
jgi:hypothetical protein